MVAYRGREKPVVSRRITHGPKPKQYFPCFVVDAVDPFGDGLAAVAEASLKTTNAVLVPFNNSNITKTIVPSRVNPIYRWPVASKSLHFI